MQDGLLSRIIDRAVANARAIRGAPEAIAVAGVIAVGMSYFGFQHYRERLADLKERLASQDRLLTEYRAKLSGANPEEAATQIEQLTAALVAAEKRLSAAKKLNSPRVTSVVVISSRDRHRFRRAPSIEFVHLERSWAGSRCAAGRLGQIEAGLVSVDCLKASHTSVRAAEAAFRH